MLLLESKRILPGSSRERKAGYCRRRLAGSADLCNGDERVRGHCSETSAMTASVLGRRLALVLALAAAGCGSTVDVNRLGTSPTGGSNGTQSLSVPSNAPT